MEPDPNTFRKVRHVIVSLLDFFEEELFIPELKSTTKDAALAEMVNRLTSTGRIKDDGILLEMLHQRESLGSTGIGRGVAVPHGRSLAIGRLTIVLGRSTAGIDFDAMDSKPVHLVFLTVAPPQERSNLYLPVLGKIVEVVKSARIRKMLLNAADYKQLAAIISEVDEDA